MQFLFHFTFKKTEAERYQMTCLIVAKWQCWDLNLERLTPASESLLLHCSTSLKLGRQGYGDNKHILQEVLKWETEKLVYNWRGLWTMEGF